ncbi:MAG: nucleoside hydrolase-like domain-containing protein [Tunicatimonas sp.]|uniref:nucleoside hydrolase-like domain-containing protein n=1 Tax=Tunicatimonas sp. TaxID=1940096 RepID=UPI003C723B81
MKLPIFLLFAFSFVTVYQALSQQKARVVVLTDIENEPDDAQSLVRFLVFSNHFDTEALIATTSTHLRDTTAEWRIREIVEAYGKVRANLLKHESGFPAEEFFHSVTKKGVARYGMEGVGAGMDSEGSDWLIEVVDKEDDRPVWITVWGGANVLAQALWKVRTTRTSTELDQFVKKLRVYTISDQDDSAPWIREEFPDLFYIVSPGENYRNATWAGISGEPHRKFASGADTTTVKNPWLRENIMEAHGPLGAEYPEVEYAMEGDTPSFLSLINNGLNVPDRPDYGGWGGRYELYQPRFQPYRNREEAQPETRPIWTDTQDEVRGNDGRIYISNHATIWRWREAFQNDFAARMDWCVQSYEDANHPPEAVVSEGGEIEIAVGEEITLDASASSDPDGDELRYQWIHYPEAGSYWEHSWRGFIELENTNQAKLKVKIPAKAKISIPQTTHIILQVTDNGTPSLTRYQRIILNLMPSKD